MLADKIAHYNETAEQLKVTPAQYKQEYGFLREVDSLALANAQLNLEGAYRNFFRDKSVGFPKFKSKKASRKSYTTNSVKNNIERSGGGLKLPKAGRVKIVQHRAVPEQYTLKSVTVSETPTGKYYASILYEYERTAECGEITGAIGVSFPAADVFADSEGGGAHCPQPGRREAEKLRRMSRALSKMKKFGSNWQKQRRKLAALHEKVANRRKDFLHKQSRQIANAYDLAGVGDLDAQDLPQPGADSGFGMFRAMLRYKLEEAGKYMVTVEREFLAGKKCSAPGCGRINEGLDPAAGRWVCPECGAAHDRDINAAVNIRNEAVRLASAPP